MRKFPVFSLFNREFGGDGFARDSLHSQPVRVLRVRPAALSRSPEKARVSRAFARHVAGRVTGRDPLSQGTRPRRAIISAGRFRGHTTRFVGRRPTPRRRVAVCMLTVRTQALGRSPENPPPFPGFCAGCGGGRDRERPVIAGNAASARHFLCRPFWWSHNAD